MIRVSDNIIARCNRLVLHVKRFAFWSMLPTERLNDQLLVGENNMTVRCDVSSKVYANNGNSDVLCRVPTTARRILDIGCGAGDNARAIRSSSEGHYVVGVTLSDAEAILARRYCDDVIIANLEDGLPNLGEQQFDVVLCSHVLEHICYPDQLLDDIWNILANEGILVIALPNLLFYKYRFRLLVGQFEYKESGIMDYTHFRWYTYKSAQQLIRQHCFEVVESTTSSSIPLPVVRRCLPRSLVANLDRLGGFLWPGLFGSQLIYVCKKRLES